VVTALGTLLSRVLGMVRDMATASLLGLAGGGVMDAFSVAYRLPNLFRRLFGEGALTASYLPVLAADLETDRRKAWQLSSVLLAWLAALLLVLTLVGELLLAAAWLVWGGEPATALLIGLSAAMLPYMLLICLAAQLSTTLHALRHFAVPALTPTVLNVCWLAAAWLVAPRLSDDRETQAYVLAASIVLAGVLQVLFQVPTLRRLGFRFDYNPPAARDGLRRIALAMLPMLAGLAVTQVNTLADSLIAWGLAASPEGSAEIAWLGGTMAYPLRQGAAAAVYYGERFYQFPLGVLGMAVAAAIFPLLSRHAARGDLRRLGSDLTLGLRLVVCLGVPAGAGLALLAEPIVRLVLEHGRFTPDDTVRTARMIACYAAGVPAFCALPVVVRGFYAVGDAATPARLAGAVVALNLALNLVLIWTPLGEAGLAVATAVSSTLQVAVLLALFSRRRGTIAWRPLGMAAARAAAATVVMLAAGVAALWALPAEPNLAREAARVVVPMILAAGAYCGAYQLLGGTELVLILSGRPAPEGDYDDEL
jgi:putative peptidoglycan lipid II flippase